MVHVLASHLRSEFLAVPELVRFDMPQGKDGFEPTLLIKSNSLRLKYLLREKSFRLIVTRVGQKIAYGVEIPDDPDAPALAWSFLERSAEARALSTLIENPQCVVFLFNELAVSVAWTKVEARIDTSFSAALENLEFHPELDQTGENIVADRFDEIRADPNVQGAQVLPFSDVKWHELRVHYVTNSIGSSSLSLFNEDEGGQQEELAVWLTDALHPKGCVKSPQVQETVPRELTDILLSYDYGAILIESKALTILARNQLPDRRKLASDLAKHLRKASKQLVGGIRNLKNGLAVKDQAGNELYIEREKPAHCIILVPDLSLLHDATDFGKEFIFNFMEATGGFLHILDPAELLRVVQASEMIARNSTRLTPIMGFDWYLMKRAEYATKHDTPHLGVLFRQE